MEIAESTHFMYGLLDSHSRLEKVAGIQADLLDTEITQETSLLDRLQEEKKAKFFDREKSAASQRNWSVLSKTAQYLLSGSALALAATSSAKDNNARISLIASGVAGLASRILHDTGALIKMAGCKWAKRIETGLFGLSVGLGAYGGMQMQSPGTLSEGIEKIRSIASKISFGSGLGKGIVDFTQAAVHKNEQFINASLQRITLSIAQIFQRMNQSCKDAGSLISSVGTIGESLKESIQSLRHRN